VAWKVVPFFLIMMLFTALLTVFPSFVTWPVDFILSR
jgi:TRAP-type C4-dicarboxylate transport system permease large subunit